MQNLHLHWRLSSGSNTKAADGPACYDDLLVQPPSTAAPADVLLSHPNCSILALGHSVFAPALSCHFGVPAITSKADCYQPSSTLAEEDFRLWRMTYYAAGCGASLCPQSHCQEASEIAQTRRGPIKH